MTEKLILAVDGGATKTTIVLRSLTGHCLYEKTTGGTNYQTIGVQHAEEILNELLLDAYASTKFSDISIGVFAMAGIDTDDDFSIVNEMISNTLSKCPFLIDKIIIENDVHSALLGLLGLSQPGALLISGTGAICYGTNGYGTVIRTGGWGHRGGDEGSGYWIGRQIVKAVFSSEDGRNEKPTILKDLVFNMLRINHIDQLMQWLYHPDYTNAQLASLSKLLDDAILIGDEQANSIAHQAANELSKLVMATLRNIQKTNEAFTLYFNGGVLKHNKLILNLVQQNIKQVFPNISFVLCKQPPIDYIVRRAIYALL